MKSKADRMSDEALRDYVKAIEKSQSEEMQKYLDEDENYQEKIKKYRNYRYVSPRKKIMRFAAVFAVVVVIAGTVLPTSEASAWFVWKLDMLFGHYDDHTDVRPDDENTFPQLYVSDIPDGFNIDDEIEDDSFMYVKYINKEKKTIVFYQVQKEQYSTQIDNENRVESKELIGDYEVLVSKGEEDVIFEFVTDKVVITVRTNAGYEIGRAFVEGLKKI